MGLSLRATVFFLRFGLAASFISAVADRFGYWGAAGASGVVWGNFANFTAYTQTLNPWAGAALVPALAWAATALEGILAVLLMLGLWLKQAAWLSGALLLIFALSMLSTVGLKAPLDYSVFTASAAGFALFFLLSVKE